MITTVMELHPYVDTWEPADRHANLKAEKAPVFRFPNSLLNMEPSCSTLPNSPSSSSPH